jgi:hypothetical protein
MLKAVLERNMIYEQRTYDIHPQHFSAYLALFEKLAMPIRSSGQ